MIICAALKIKGSDTVIGCCRHGDGYSTLHDIKPELGCNDVIEGFITNTGEFLDRIDAYDHAKKCCQVSMTTWEYKHEKGEIELYSEDLY